MGIPEEGQLVSVRDRYWIAKSITPSTLPPDVLSGDTIPQHFVELSSVEDDGLGDELQVIWQVEPGARVLETGNLPKPVPGKFDDPQRLRTFLDAVRWGAVTSADSNTLQAPFRSGITIEDYQLDPVVRALGMARVNLLIADDVGLGKTIEAGLIIQELVLRHRVRSAMILCPPSLCLKWQGEMRDRFGLDFRIVDSEAVRRLRRDRGRNVKIFEHFPRLIVSFDWLKLERGMRLLRQYLPSDKTAYPRTIDLLVVDEVHQCAPAGNGTYGTDSLRTQLLREIGPHAEHRLFLSATPHNGYQSSFLAMLELLDPQRFARGVKPDPVALQNAVVRRMKSEIRALGPGPDGRLPFPERRIEKIGLDYPDVERVVHADLVAYTALRKQGSATSAPLAADLVSLLLKKRLFSSPAAFERTLTQHIATLEGRGKGEDDASLRSAYEWDDDDFDTEDARDDAAQDAIAHATRAGGPISAAERVLLDRMLSWAQQNAGRNDEKSRALIERLGEWGDERVIIFTEYRASQMWLQEMLAAKGLASGGRVRLLFGGMDDDERERIKAAFQSDPAKDPLRILIATDTASEGIDLQRHCRRMIHLEIPFNPNRLEQRNGRIDRHGQPYPEVFIYHFASNTFDKPGTLDGDLDFLYRAANKLETIREDLGNAGAVLAKNVEDALLGRSVDLDAPLRPSATESRLALRAERDLRGRVEAMHAEVLKSRELLGVTPDAIARVVDVGLELGRQNLLEPVTLKPRRNGEPSLQAYDVPDLNGSWARACENLFHPLTDERLPITFDNAGADGREDVVLGHLGHRLVAQATRLLRAQIWAPPNDAKVARITGRLVDDASLAEPGIILTSRLVIIGADGYRLHEELFECGGRITPRFARFNVGEVRAASAALGDRPIPLHHQEAVAAAWDGLSDALLATMQARATDIRGQAMRQLSDRAEREVKALEEVMLQLQRAIKEELRTIDEHRADQLWLFDTGNPHERRQYEGDVGALRRRADDIPAEIERESARLRHRYAEPRQVAFPAAVTILVPRRYADTTLDIAGGHR